MCLNRGKKLNNTWIIFSNNYKWFHFTLEAKKNLTCF